MYDNAHLKIRITNSYSNPINVLVEVHQGSVLRETLFVIVMEALSREFRTGCPRELLYAEDLVIVAESLGELKVRLKNSKDGLEEKGLKVNIRKTKALGFRHMSQNRRLHLTNSQVVYVWKALVPIQSSVWVARVGYISSVLALRQM